MDKYKSFAKLYENEQSDAYKSDARVASSKYVIIAPHGGGIEPGTTEIADHIAGDVLSYYSFVGVKDKGNKVLHIASEKYDEVQARRLVESSDTAISIHGEGGDDQNIYIGGLNEKLINKLSTALQKAKFPVSKKVPPNLGGKDPNNICNGCKTKQGVQIEISLGLRKKMFKGMNKTGRKERTDKFNVFVQTVRDVLK